jgi:hypothetical protein
LTRNGSLRLPVVPEQGQGLLSAMDAFDETLFGRVVKDERFTFHAILTDEPIGGRFKKIQVAENSFKNTKVDGTVIDLGMLQECVFG